eukprot:4474545-Alexandrium_andersonii.AAC.1
MAGRRFGEAWTTAFTGCASAATQFRPRRREAVGVLGAAVGPLSSPGLAGDRSAIRRDYDRSW